jgi:hypothetical protein
MGNLSNLFISQSFKSLIHLETDTSIAPISPTELQDGVGTPLGIFVDTEGNFRALGEISSSLLAGIGNVSEYSASVASRLGTTEIVPVLSSYPSASVINGYPIGKLFTVEEGDEMSLYVKGNSNVYSVPLVIPGYRHLIARDIVYTNGFEMEINTLLTGSGTTTNTQFQIPTDPTQTYNYYVEWGDGSSDENVTGSITHTYATAGTYTVKIFATFPKIYFADLGDDRKVTKILQWGGNVWGTTQQDAFRGCSNLVITATDTPNFSNVTSTRSMFRLCPALTDVNGTLDGIDFSNVTDARNMFDGATVFNANPVSWNTGQLASAQGMFANSAFNRDIGAWNISNLTGPSSMFVTTALTTANMDAIFNGWADQIPAIESGVTMTNTGRTYSVTGKVGRDALVANGWTITGDTLV